LLHGSALIGSFVPEVAASDCFEELWPAVLAAVVECASRELELPWLLLLPVWEADVALLIEVPAVAGEPF
jgi:hypothetical protein